MDYLTLQPKYDRYGFSVQKSLTSSQTKKESRDELMRERKWQEIIPIFDIFRLANHSKFHSLVKKGIPDSFRSLIWPFLVHTPQTAENIDPYFKPGTIECQQIIEADVPRTFNYVSMFSEPSKQQKLFKVLLCYAVYDSQRKVPFGYTQGMSFICAFLLMYLDENTAFWSFRNLMDHDPWRLSEFYKPGFPRLLEISKIWDFILGDKLPKVKSVLLSFNITSMVYLANWFLGLFLNIDLPPSVRLNIFERFFTFGSRALLSFGMTIMNLAKKTVLNGNYDQIFEVIQYPQKIPSLMNERTAVIEYDKNWLSKKYYQTIFRKCGVCVVY